MPDHGIEAGQRWQHDGGIVYVVSGLCRLKCPETREWHDGVIYAAEGVMIKAVYVRTAKDFLGRFGPAPG
jgi:hypothetical protein